MIITRTPYRVSLLGGGSDYPEWSNLHGGAVLSATINHYCWISVRRPTPFGYRYRAIYSHTENSDTLEGIHHPAIRECLRYLDIDGCEVFHTSDLPARSGMGSSSAFVVGLLNALHELKGDSVGYGQLAGEAIHVERVLLGETVGCQDQVACSYGGLNLITFPKGGGTPNAEQLLHPRGNRSYLLDELSSPLMLFYTGIQRTSSDVARGYLTEMLADEDRMSGLMDRAWLGRDALLGQDYIRFGSLLDENWQFKRSLPGASNEVIDSLYNKALEAGALGGKVLGAGGGGFLLLLAPPEAQEGVRSALSGLTEVPFAFEAEGSVVAYDGR